MHATFRRWAASSTVLAIALTSVTSLVPLSAEAQSDGSSRYTTWAAPGSAAAQGGDLDGLLKDLNTLIKEAEKARAADPVFLRDLKNLAARYENPWTQRVLFDDFSDGDFRRDPAWTVASGEFWVEQGYGLRAKSSAPAAAAADSESRQVSKEEAIIGILGAVLQGGNRQQNDTQDQQQAAKPAAKAEPAVIETRARIPNAFAMNVELSSWADVGAFELAVIQGVSGAGYRVVYTVGDKPRLELVKVTSGGRGVVDGASLGKLEDQKVHSLQWTRTKDGTMTVSVDGKQMLSARDAGFRDAFDGLAIAQAGTDVIVKSIEVLGAR